MKQCKECLQEKELDEFYNHPQTKDKKLPRCKECIKAGRRTEKEREMARIRDKARTKTEKFKAKQKRYSEKFKKEQPEKRKAQVRVSNYLRYRKWLKPKNCIVCNSENHIHLHHFDYSKPLQVIPCCARCHSKFHSWGIEVKDSYILDLSLYS